ncbi:ATP-binding protein [Nakamurella sp. GG22]
MVARNTREQVRRVDAPAAAPLLITDGALVTAGSVWAWVQIPIASTFLAEEDDLDQATLATARSLAAVLPPAVDYHLKVIPAPHSGDAYRRSWAGFDSVRSPNAEQYIDLGAHRIDLNAATGTYRRKVVLLGIRCLENDPNISRTTATGFLNRLAGPATPSKQRRDAVERLAAAQPGIEKWHAAVARYTLHGTPAAAGMIAWAYAREVRRTALPVPEATVVPGPMLAGLCHGDIDPTLDPRFVRVTDLTTGSAQYVSILTAAAGNGFPAQDLELPGGEWLEILTDIHGVEANVRGVNHGQVGSRALLDRGLKTARSQVTEAEEAGAPVPGDAVEAVDTLTDRRAEVQHRHDVEGTQHPRWVVTADTPMVLAERVAALQQRYDGIVQLQQVPHIQDLLWKELLPGDQVRVPEFGHDQPLRTLAGSWFHGGSPFGDPAGPYMGANLGSSADPVQLHIASRTDTDRTMPTTLVFTGRSGGGKSTAACLTLLGLLAEGAWALLVDNKGDLAGIVDAARRVLGVTVQEVDVLHPSCAGTMDPMRFAPTADEARTLTLDVLLGALSADDRRRGETVLEAAIDHVLAGPRETWSSPSVIAALQDGSAADPNAGVAQAISGTLRVRAKTPQLRAVLGDLHPKATPLMTGRGLIYLRLDGLDLPRHTPDPAQWSVAQRCSMATMRIAFSYALLQSRRARTMVKVVALTELHLLTAYPEGRAFVDWLARVGRALKTYLLLDSQSARDLADMIALLEQILMAFCFQATGTTEQDAQAVLLGRPDPGPRLRAAMADLHVGQCVARDRHRRLTVMEFDRLTQWIADTLSTDADDDTPNTTPPDPHTDPNPDGSTDTTTGTADTDEFALFGADQ